MLLILFDKILGERARELEENDSYPYKQLIIRILPDESARTRIIGRQLSDYKRIATECSLVLSMNWKLPEDARFTCENHPGKMAIKKTRQTHRHVVENDLHYRTGRERCPRAEA